MRGRGFTSPGINGISRRELPVPTQGPSRSCLLVVGARCPGALHRGAGPCSTWNWHVTSGPGLPVLRSQLCTILSRRGLNNYNRKKNKTKPQRSVPLLLWLLFSDQGLLSWNWQLSPGWACLVSVAHASAKISAQDRKPLSDT